MAKKKPERQVVQEKQKERQGKRKRGRPEKLLKIDDSPRNIARALFRLPPLEFDRKKSDTA